MGSLKYLLATALVILEVGCGLPNPYFLAAPTVSTLGSISTAPVFLSPGYNLGAQTTFLGFEVYYKFFASSTNVDINLGGGGYPGPGVLQQNGYMPICQSTDKPPLQRNPPAIPISLGTSQTSFSMTLNISSTGASSTTPATVELDRDVSYSASPSTAKTFAVNSSGYPPGISPPQNYVQGVDADISSAVWSSFTGAQVYVNLYILAYGYQLGTTSVVYSVPAYLGYVTVTGFP